MIALGYDPNKLAFFVIRPREKRMTKKAKLVPFVFSVPFC